MGDPLAIEVRHEQDYVIVTAAGEIDISTVTRMRECLRTGGQWPPAGGRPGSGQLHRLHSAPRCRVNARSPLEERAAEGAHRPLHRRVAQRMPDAAPGDLELRRPRYGIAAHASADASWQTSSAAARCADRCWQAGRSTMTRQSGTQPRAAAVEMDSRRAAVFSEYTAMSSSSAEVEIIEAVSGARASARCAGRDVAPARSTRYGGHAARTLMARVTAVASRHARSHVSETTHAPSRAAERGGSPATDSDARCSAYRWDGRSMLSSCEGLRALR